MSWFRPKSKKGLQLGIGIHPDGRSFVLLDHCKSEKRIVSCDFIPAIGDDAVAAQLNDYVRKHKLQNIPTVLSLDPDAYSLIQVESPEVAPNELPNAIRWRVKELLDFHIDDAVLDLFDVPEARRAGGQKMLYVVATKMSAIQKLVDQVDDAGLSLDSIDICELSLRNLVSHSTDAAGYHALLYLSPGYGMIEIIEGDTLYLNRHIEISSVDVEEQGGFGLEEIYETLALELQRSLDFCETQYAMGSIKKVLVVAPESRLDGVIDRIKENLSVNAEGFDLASAFHGTEEVSFPTLSRCMPSMGAALRGR